MAAAPLSDLVVEILHNRGDDTHPNWSVGSGYFVGAHLVLTAAHNVDGPGVVLVRVHGTEEYSAEVRLLGDTDLVDLALLEVPDRSVTVPPLRYAVVDRAAAAQVKPCWAVGFPQLKERTQKPKAQRFSAQVDGYIPTGDNLDRPQLTLLVTRYPRPASSSARTASEWAGMSGAVVFAGDNIVVGVIAEHHLPEGESALTIVPITVLDQLPSTEAAKWWNLLGVKPGALVPLPDSAGVTAGVAINLADAEERYRQQVIDAYRHLRFSGFEQSDLLLDAVPLEHIFVRLHLLVEQVRRESVEPAEARHRTRGEALHQERIVIAQEPITLAQALKKPLLLVGEPGAGKSTLLRWLAVTFAQNTQRELERIGPEAAADRLPILIELGRLPAEYLQGEGGKTPNWDEVVPQVLVAQQDFAKTPPALFHQAIKEGRCLLLFDGLDEVANRQARARISRSLAELPRLLPGVGIVIGSRQAGLSENESALRPTFERCEIQRFTPEELQRFFRFWYALDRSLTSEEQAQAAAALFARLQALPGTLRLATTPLLATILLLLWRVEGTLPERRTSLYARCCRVLVQAWELAHDVPAPGLLAHLDWEQHVQVLTPIAYAIHQQERRTSLSRQDLLPLLEQALQTTKLCADPLAAAQEARQFLEMLGLRSGLLQSLGDEQYGFPHLTFQEYLAARYIAEQADPASSIDLMLEHLHEAWWQEVQVLTIGHLGADAGSAPKASAVLLAILCRYRPPSWFLRSSRHRWVRLIGPGKWLPRVQVERRLAWMLKREEMLALLAAAECAPAGLQPQVHRTLTTHAVKLVQTMERDWAQHPLLMEWLSTVGQRLAPAEREAMVQGLLAALQDANAGGRGRAAGYLGQIGNGSEAAIQGLLAALQDAEAVVRGQAAQSLGQIGKGSEPVVQGLRAALQDAEAVVRGQAAQSLEQIGRGSEPVVQGLRAALQDANADVRVRAAQSLGQIGRGSETEVQWLVAALQDANADVRWPAAMSLGQIGRGSEVAVQGLVAALQDAYWGMRGLAAMSLGQIGRGSEVAVQGLLAALQDTNAVVRWQAAQSLGQIGRGSEPVVQGLLAALQDADVGVRRLAAESLGQIGRGSEAAVQGLVAALQDAEAVVRVRAAQSLGQLEIKASEQLHRILVALNQRLHSVDGGLREAALTSIQHLLAGRSFPGTCWIPVQQRRTRARQRRRIVVRSAFVTAVAVFLVLLDLGAAGVLDAGSLVFRLLAGINVSLAAGAGLATLLGRTLNDPWDQNKEGKQHQ